MPAAWENQNDNASGTGYRECFSSSCAMLARYWGKVGSDDEYNAIRAQYGDSTSAEAQLSALRSLGLTANFATNGDLDDLEEQINQGQPVLTGVLRKVQLMPSALVMIRLPLPLVLIATSCVRPDRLLYCVRVIGGPVFAFA